MSSKTLKVPTAITEHTRLNLDSVHVTTANFMDFNCAKSMELVPKQKVTINHRTFTRLDPMELPTFGDAKIHNKYFFVPFRTVMPAWNDFIEDVAHTYDNGTVGHITTVPQIYNSSFVRLFRLASYSTLGQTVYYAERHHEAKKAILENSDIVISETNTSQPNNPKFVCYNLTPKGVRALKILTSLGYGIDWSTQNSDIFHSALPLLCLARVYMDWYYPSTYIQDSVASDILTIFSTDSPTYQGAYFDEYLLDKIFTVLDRVCYDADYFVSAWDNPVSPTSGSYSDILINDPTSNGSNKGSVGTSSNGTPMTHNGSSESNAGTTPSSYNRPITQFMVNSLRRLTDYMKRNQLAGARVLDRYLSRFGIALPSVKLNRSEYLSDFNFTVNFADVTNMSGAAESELGSYAGIGIGKGGGSLTYEATEYGMLLCVSTVVTYTSYFQGCDRNTMHLTKLDFWTPEFDSLGVQAMTTREVFMPFNSSAQIGTDQTNPDVVDSRTSLDYDACVFGFTSRYAEYKTKRDILSGDYRLGSRNTSLDAWHLMRDLRPSFEKSGVYTRHDIDFVRGSDARQYDRIFYSSAEDVEHFKLIHIFNIDTVFPGKPLYDSYDFKDEDESQKVNVEIGGVKAN